MEYIYDIVLNFKDKYYDFYEWNKKDKIINIKKIPIYRINNKDYLNIKNNDVIIIRNTLPKANRMFLLASNKEVIGILLDNDGKVLKKSSLIFEELDDILLDVSSIKYINIKYIIKKKNKPRLISRVQEEKQKYVNKYLKQLDKQKDEYLLKYLYYEIYKLEENDIDIVYKKILKTDINKLYDSIKKVNIELKKLSF